MRQLIGALLLGALAATTAARADTLLIDGLEQAKPSAAQRPTRGMSMAAVTAHWGEPAGKAGPVGEPPITRWDYPGFAVFFEHSHVVHAVAAR
ncbi:MAG: hypothetical protein IT486_08785 [Gammaproteobacteria bacterium]|nr:hypothetical protein [Gammaproteobacteria bacterium]